jgi:hypothetical protein
MNFLLWGITLGTLGKLIIGLAVLRVHVRIFEEHSIDGVVLKAIKREHFFTMLGIFFIISGYLLEILFYNGSTAFFECKGAECAGIVESAFEATK